MRKGDSIITSFPACSQAFSLLLPTPAPAPAPRLCFHSGPIQVAPCPAAPRSPGRTHGKMCFPGRAALSCACVHFSAAVCLFPTWKQSSSIPEHKAQTVVGGRDICTPVNLLPSPVYSLCRSSPLSEWPINSRLTAHSDGPDFSYLGWHSRISKYFLVECSIWLPLLFNS